MINEEERVMSAEVIVIITLAVITVVVCMIFLIIKMAT
jgi:hypothetical protein